MIPGLPIELHYHKFFIVMLLIVVITPGGFGEGSRSAGCRRREVVSFILIGLLQNQKNQRMPSSSPGPKGPG